MPPFSLTPRNPRPLAPAPTLTRTTTPYARLLISRPPAEPPRSTSPPAEPVPAASFHTTQQQNTTTP